MDSLSLHERGRCCVRCLSAGFPQVYNEEVWRNIAWRGGGDAQPVLALGLMRYFMRISTVVLLLMLFNISGE